MRCVGIITIPSKKGGFVSKKYIDWLPHVTFIPIPYDTTEHEKYFKMINGLIIPGSIIGESQIIPADDIVLSCISKFLLLSLYDYFPIWGICYGFHLLVCAISGLTHLKIHHSEGLQPIRIYKSRMFSGFSKQILDYLHSESTFHNHDYGISVEDFTNNKDLMRFYNITATGVCDNNKTYVANIEAKYYPIYGLQWHPENTPKMSEFSDFFISELNKNKHACSARNFDMIPTPCHFSSDYLCYYF